METKKVVKYMLVVMLCLNFLLPLITFAINQEAWFFSYKLGGIKALCWLLTNGIIGVVIAFSLLKNWKHAFLASFFLFGINFVNAMLVPLPLAYPPFFSLGVIISFIGIVEKYPDNA